MKKIISILCSLALILQIGFPIFIVSAGAADNSGQNARTRTVINEGWKFKWYGSDGSTDASGSSFDESGWESVSVPHCWNADDGADGGGNYRRGVGWYRKTMSLNLSDYKGKQVFLEFWGVSQQADVYVNGNHMGNHKGGYTLFRFDVTDQLKDGENIIAVKADNTNGGKTNTIIAPIVGDFTVYGGMYRDVALVVTEPVHVDMIGEKVTGSQSGETFYTAPSTGLKLTTENISSTSATLKLNSRIVNSSDTEASNVKVTATLKHPEFFEEIKTIEKPFFNVNEMKDGSSGNSVIESQSYTFPNIDANGSVDFNKTFTVSNPHLWNGRTDPYRYLVELTVEMDGKIVDIVSDYVGFRYFEVKESSGFYLNGKNYNLRGVSRHQDREGKGYAITKKEHDEDFGLIYEMGANSIRLAHYPQDPYFYDLCDKYGIVVWAEIPYIGGNNDGASSNDKNKLMHDTTIHQMRELITQQYNHPSIVMWGLENEVGHQANADLAKSWVTELNNLAHSMDPSRLTTLATNVNNPLSDNQTWPSDLIAWNKYPGWYGGSITGLGSTMDGLRNKKDTRPVGISEYGAGGNIAQHDDKSYTSVPSSGWHPEEFQSDLHEAAIKSIKERNWLWCTYVWNMFDFGSDGRNEGGQKGINDKGLVTFDRKTKKDAFYLYKANWNKQDLFVHLNSRRYDPRYEAEVPYMKVYSNCDRVTLQLNDGEAIEGTKRDDVIFEWKNLTLQQGENKVVVTGYQQGNNTPAATETVTLRKAPSNITTLESYVLQVDNSEKTIGLTQAVSVDGIDATKIADVLQTTSSGASYKVCDMAGMEVTAGLVSPGMKVIVTAEDGTEATYSVTSLYLSYKKPITASSAENDKGNLAEYALDFNAGTRWAATSGYPQWVIVDLEAVYRLTGIGIDWFKSGDTDTRSYKYKVLVSKDSTTWQEVVDRSNNSTAGTVYDTLNEIEGRYVKIDISGCTTSWAQASIYEMEINGWSLSSADAGIIVDHENRMIRVGDNAFANADVTPEQILSKLIFAGDAKIAYASTGGAGSYFVVDNDSFVITDPHGVAATYMVDMPGNEDTPVYSVLSTGKPVTYSSQAANEVASYINDDNINTRWAAKGTGSGNNIAQFPEHVVIDLGKVASVKQLDLTFFKYNDGGRVYQYEVLVSSDGTNYSKTT